MKPLKRLERYLSAIFKLGRTEWMAKQSFKRLDQVETQASTLSHDLGGTRHDLGQVAEDIRGIWSSISQLEQAHGEHDRRFEAEYEKVKAGDAALARTLSDLTHRMDMLLLNRDRLGLPEQGANALQSAPAGLPASDGFEAFKDSFYHTLENRYRGSVADIANRLRIYLPDVEAAVLRAGGKPVMDIGCGRGEWLGLLRDNEIEAFGVDTNAVQMDEARKQGLDVRLGDAIAFLAEADDASLSVITAHHLIEHLPFDAVAWITREAMRVLAPGGLLLFETPNTRNVLVGATTFHTDPTHLKPMPEQVMSVLLDTAGFHPVEIRHLHPHERFQEFLAKSDFNTELASLMFGPQDLAILGTRPLGE